MTNRNFDHTTKEARAMFRRGENASLKSPHDLDYWDAKLGHKGDLYTIAFLDGWSYAATGETEIIAPYKFAR